jgi:hypothetical protein
MSRKKRHDGGKIVNNFFSAKWRISGFGSENVTGAEQSEGQTGNQIVPGHARRCRRTGCDGCSFICGLIRSLSEAGKEFLFDRIAKLGARGSERARLPLQTQTVAFAGGFQNFLRKLRQGLHKRAVACV